MFNSWANYTFEFFKSAIYFIRFRIFWNWHGCSTKIIFRVNECESPVVILVSLTNAESSCVRSVGCVLNNCAIDTVPGAATRNQSPAPWKSLEAQTLWRGRARCRWPHGPMHAGLCKLIPNQLTESVWTVIIAINRSIWRCDKRCYLSWLMYLSSAELENTALRAVNMSSII